MKQDGVVFCYRFLGKIYMVKSGLLEWH